MRKLAGLGVLLVGCSGNAADASPEWTRVEAHCGYSFLAPPGVVVRAGQPFDSCLDDWTTQSCEYSGDYGLFSSELEELKGSAQYTALQESIDGRAALVVTAAAKESLRAAVFFREVDPAVEGIRLTISANCQDIAGQQDALKLFRSIAFTAVSVEQ
jgi:hypothetical protein